jgi:hypothetical protein
MLPEELWQFIACTFLCFEDRVSLGLVCKEIHFALLHPENSSYVFLDIPTDRLIRIGFWPGLVRRKLTNQQRMSIMYDLRVNLFAMTFVIGSSTLQKAFCDLKANKPISGMFILDAHPSLVQIVISWAVRFRSTKCVDLVFALYQLIKPKLAKRIAGETVRQDAAWVLRIKDKYGISWNFQNPGRLGINVTKYLTETEKFDVPGIAYNAVRHDLVSVQSMYDRFPDNKAFELACQSDDPDTVEKILRVMPSKVAQLKLATRVHPRTHPRTALAQARDTLDVVSAICADKPPIDHLIKLTEHVQHEKRVRDTIVAMLLPDKHGRNGLMATWFSKKIKWARDYWDPELRSEYAVLLGIARNNSARSTGADTIIRSIVAQFDLCMREQAFQVALEWNHRIVQCFIDSGVRVEQRHIDFVKSDAWKQNWSPRKKILRVLESAFAQTTT